jgi:para-aminobenzoate synthetase component 1
VSGVREQTAGRGDTGAPIGIEIDWLEPEKAFLALAGRPHRFWLDSALVDDRLGGRWSYVGADPDEVIELRDHNVWRNGSRCAVIDDPMGTLLAALRHPRRRRDPRLPVPFQTGLVGYLGYEAGRYLEPSLGTPLADPFRLPDLILADYATILAFDHRDRRAWIVARASTGAGDARPERVDTLRHLLATGSAAGPPDALEGLDGDLVCNLDAHAFKEAVQRIVAAILAGEVFQANIARRYRGRLPQGTDPASLYRQLRRLSPTPFAAFLDLGQGRAILSASPERFVRVEDGRVETRPIKGTRPRAPDPDADRALARELLSSEKDRAENVMIVDLLRNDLYRSCEPGSVRVEALCALHSFPRVHHLVSTISGRTTADPLDVLLRAFPGGSITGAPKIRAMQLIRALEPDPRDAYCGTILWYAGDALDSSIVIRTLVVNGRTVTFHAGGGITAASDPASEEEETRVKARPLLELLGAAAT